MHSLLAIFAHPDDETTVAPMLARYAAEGHNVHLVSITSGEKGFRPHFNMPRGEQLGAVRRDELRSAARALGIHEPIFLGFEDQGISSAAASAQAGEKLRDVIRDTRADVLITWGPDGITGHVDHRVASTIAATVFQHESLLAYKPSKLYYLAFPESLFQANPNPLNRKTLYHLVADEFITSVIDCRPWLEPALRAMQCHNSQWRPERMIEVHGMYAEFFGGRVYLRLALSRVPVPGGRETSVFEGLD